MDTLLFIKDFDRFPTAIVDTKTKNTSFLEFSALLRSMGVKNHYFMLALFNPELQGVDPFDPFLTDAQKLAIRIECTFNPWYFIREVMRVPPTAGDTPVRLEANRGNISLWWCFLNHIDYFLIQIRQTGKSLNTDGISVWYQIFGARNSRANLFTKGDLVKEHIARLKKIRSLLPTYLVRLVKKDTDNQKEFTNMAQGNRMVAYIAQKDEDAARNVGRGLTSPYTHVDEVAFLSNVHISVPAMLAGGGAAREEAARNGLPYGNIFTTTAGKLDTPEGEFAYKLLTNGAPWSETFYDCVDKDDLYRTVGAGCRDKEAILINGTFSHRQLGKSDEWLRRKIAESRQSGDDVRRDYLNEWTSGTLTNPLPRDVLEKIRSSVIEPVYAQRHQKEGYMVRWYLPAEEVISRCPDRQFVLGLDTANAVGRDNITGVLLDISTLETAASFTVNDSNLQCFAAWLASFMARFPNVTLVPENRSSWPWILDYLLMHLPSMGVDPGRRIYSRIVDERNSSEQARRRYEEFTNDRNHYEGFRKEFGFPTNGPLRELIYTTVLQEAGKKAGSLVRDRLLAGELAKLVTKRGRIDHEASGHDDHVISWLLAHWFLTYAYNLDHYGIDVSQVKRRVYEAEHQLSWTETRKRQQQETYREQIAEVVDALSATRDPLLIAKLDHKLDNLYNKLEDVDDLGQVASIDALREVIREQRQRNRSRYGAGREIDLQYGAKPLLRAGAGRTAAVTVY